jgi:hypothetical protein
MHPLQKGQVAPNLSDNSNIQDDYDLALALKEGLKDA